MTKPKRKSPSGKATNDLIFSAKHGTNADQLPEILSLYAAPGAVIADVTYGRGVFWSKVDRSLYTLHATDLLTGTDARFLPYDDLSHDVVIFDPPYMHAAGGGTHAGHQAFAQYYQVDAATAPESRSHDSTLRLYKEAAVEAVRVLKHRGIYLVKCQDEVYAGSQWLTHVELVTFYKSLGLLVEDLFVLVRLQHPGVSRMLKQLHARKNHSYWIVARKWSARRERERGK